MKSVFNVFKRGLQRTKTTLVRRLQGVFAGIEEWTDEQFDDLEAALIGADLGVSISTRLVDDLRDRYERGLVKTTEDILRVAEDDLIGIMNSHHAPPINENPDGPTVILLVGVNGSGKTTTAAKLASLFKQDGKSVMLGAGDTFRAAGIDQLKIWGERIDCPVVAGRQGGDSAAVAFDAIQAAQRRNIDVAVIDTAGRQHTRRELMQELEKVHRTAAKACPGAPHEVWLTVDASTGTNALIQAREFGKVCDITGLILTKLDGTGKGGVVVSICSELGHPIRFIGLGEAVEDLQPFDADMFAKAIFE
jgi:fused signal recognition particle receptor